MTIEQALKINQDWTPEQAKNDLERLLLRDERPADKAIALACKALEKQIPKIPVVSLENLTDHYRYKCAVCGNRVVIGGAIWNFCPKCGQKLLGKE